MYNNPASTEKIRDAVKRSGLSQRDVARKMGVTDNTISAYVTGFRRPSAGNLFRLARALGVDVRDLMDEVAA
jgi:transcriptional regulator with XRE-family HTH domain